MRNSIMGIFMVILIIWLFQRGMVMGTTHEVFKSGFEVFDIFDVGTLVLEDPNSRID
jgi:hypothetical protein